MGNEMFRSVRRIVPSAAKSLDEGALIKCQNLSCDARILGAMIHRRLKALNIDGLGDKIIEQLYAQKLILHVKDLFTLTMDDLLTLEGLKRKKHAIF